MANERVVGFKLTLSGTEKSFETISELKEELAKVNDELANTKKGTESYKKLSAEAAQLKAEISGVNKELKDQQKAFEAQKFAAGSYRQLNAELVKLRNALKELSAEEIKSGKISDENVKKYGLASNSVKDLQNQINKLDTGLKAADKSMGNHQREVGNYGIALKGLGNLAASGGGFFAVFQGAQALIGATQDIIASTEDIFKLQGQLQQLGFPTDRIDEFAAKISGISSTFGQENQEILTAANAFSKQFGISLEQATGLIEKGFVSGLDANGDFLDLLKEFPVQFKQAGFSAEGFLSIIDRQIDQGVFSDKGLDLVKEFGLRISEQSQGAKDALENAFGKKFTTELFQGINDGSISVQTALASVAGKLDETQLPAQDLSNVIKNVFGAQGEDVGIEFIKSLKDVDQGVSGLIDTTNEYEKRQLAILEANQSLAESQVELTNLVSGGKSKFEELTIYLKKFFIDTIILVINTFSPLIDSFVEVGNAVGTFITELFGLEDSAEKGSAAFQVFSAILNGAARQISLVLEVVKFVFNGLSALAGLLRGDLSVGWRLFTSEGQQAVRVQKQVEKATLDLNKAYDEEVQGLNKLFGELANTNANTEERSNLIKKLNSEYGEYLPNIDLETAGQEGLQLAYEATTKAIAKSLIERKKIELRAEAEGALLEAITKQNLAQEKAARIAKEMSDANIRLGSDVSSLSGVILAGTKDLLGYENTTIGVARALRQANLEAAKQDQIISDNEKTLSALDKSADQLSERLSKLYTVDELKKNVNENKGLQEDLVEQEKKAAEEREKIAKSTAEQQKKLAEDIKKAAENIANLKLELIDDQYEREIAKLSKSAQDKIKGLAGSSAQIKEQTALINSLLENQIKEVEKKRDESIEKQAEAIKKANQELDKIILENERKAAQSLNNISLSENQRIVQKIDFEIQIDENQLQLDLATQKNELLTQLNDREISYREYNSRINSLETEAAQRTLELLKQTNEKRVQQSIISDQNRLNGLRFNLEQEKTLIEQNSLSEEAALQEKLNQGLISQQQYEDARISIRQAANARIAELDNQFLNEQAVLTEANTVRTLEASQRLADQQISIENTKNEQIRANNQATAKVIGDTVTTSLDFLGTLVSGAKELLEQDEENREKNAKAIEALAIAEVGIRLASELAIIAISAQQAGLAAGPGAPIAAGVIYGIQAAIAIARASFQIAKIKNANKKKKAEEGMAVSSSGFETGTISNNIDSSPFGNSNIPVNGIVTGNRHSEGGEPGLFGSMPVEVEEGEYVMRNGPEWYIINRRSSDKFKNHLRSRSSNSRVFSPERRAFASAVNSHRNWGVKFQSGGLLSSNPISGPTFSEISKDTKPLFEMFQKVTTLLTASVISTQENISALDDRVTNLKVINNPEETTDVSTEIKEAKRVKNLTIDNL